MTGEEAQTEAAEEAKTEAAEAEEAEDAADKYQGDEGEGEVAAAADSEADQTNAAAAAGPRTAAAKPKPKPRRQVRPAGKKAPKSSPAFFTGKAAGLPPPPKEACVGPPPPVADPTFSVGLGAYLVYTDAEGGRLKNQWSKTPLTGSGILAYLCPEKEVADYKFEKKSAVEIYATDCEVNTREKSVYKLNEAQDKRIEDEQIHCELPLQHAGVQSCLMILVNVDCT